MTDLEKAIAAYERTQEGPDWYVEEMTDAADELAKAAKEYLAAQEGAAASRWTPVEDGLPEAGSYVLACHGDGTLTLSFAQVADDDEVWLVNYHSSRIVAWMHLPAPYQPPKPVDPLTVVREALEMIAKGENLYANQKIAREALDKVKGEG